MKGVMSYKKIDSIDNLIDLSKGKYLSCFIHLGVCKSSKTIMYDEKEKIFDIHNEIDDTFQLLTIEELSSESNIGEAIASGNLYKHN